MLHLGRHRLALELVLAALVAYLAAFGVAAAVRSVAVALPPAPVEAAAAPVAPAPLAAYAVITERDVFNSAGSAGSAPGTHATRSGALRLWGVALEGAEARAVIEDTTTHHQDLYRVGEAVADARVAAIDWDRVTLTGPRGEETLELSAPAAGEPAPVETTPTSTAAAADRIRQTAENAWVVDRRELAGAVDNMSGLLTQLRAVAEVREGRPAGFRLFQIRDGSLFARLGLKNGDVVQRVNGTAIADPSALLGFLQRLGHEPRVALDIVRADAPRTLVYDLR